MSGCSKSSPSNGASAAKAAEAPEVQRPAASRLGDLSSFRAITLGISARLAHNDLPGARMRMQRLLTAWNGAAAGIKPRAPGDWQRLDRSIGQVRSALRGKQPAECRRSVAQLLQTFNTLRGAA